MTEGGKRSEFVVRRSAWRVAGVDRVIGRGCALRSAERASVSSRRWGHGLTI